MALLLFFDDEMLREICERMTVAENLLGPRAARKLRARLADLRAAKNITEVVAGAPSFSDDGVRATFLLHPPHQLVVEVAVKPIPRSSDGTVDWAKIDCVRVLSIVGKSR